jgi:hypothetical protein
MYGVGKGSFIWWWGSGKRYRWMGTLPYVVGRGIERKVQQERYNKKGTIRRGIPD